MARAKVGSSWLDYTLHGSGEPVLLIMGMGATQGAWAGQVDLLQRDHHLLTFDNRGMGESGPIEGRLSMRGMARDAVAVLDDAGWESAHVVGISMGGMIAQELALMARPRLRSLSLLTTHGGGRGVGPLPTAKGLSLFVRQRVAVLRDDPRRTDLLMELLFPPEVLTGPIGQATSERIDAVFGGKHSADALQAQTVASTFHHTLPRLQRLRGLPTLVVRSVRDLLVHPKAQARLHQAIPDAKLLNLHDAGHGALAQCADEIADALRAHIAEVG